MWLFLPEGMVSIVADRTAPEDGQLLVRARLREHLEEFLELVRLASGSRPGLSALETPQADYRWRCWCRREEVTAAAAEAIQGLNWSNFKNAIRDPAYHQAAGQVWGAMGALQWRQQEQEGSLDPSMRYPLALMAQAREEQALAEMEAEAAAEEQRQIEEDRAWTEFLAASEVAR